MRHRSSAEVSGQKLGGHTHRQGGWCKAFPPGLCGAAFDVCPQQSEQFLIKLLPLSSLLPLMRIRSYGDCCFLILTANPIYFLSAARGAHLFRLQQKQNKRLCWKKSSWYGYNNIKAIWVELFTNITAFNQLLNGWISISDIFAYVNPLLLSGGEQLYSWLVPLRELRKGSAVNRRETGKCHELI